MALRTALLAVLASVVLPASTSAQQQPSNAQLVKEFRDGFEQGCQQGKTPNVNNQKGYCTCMANSYQARYSGAELRAISQFAGNLGEQGPAIVNLMMAPEARACNAKY
jgi:hypothetical protein